MTGTPRKLTHTPARGVGRPSTPTFRSRSGIGVWAFSHAAVDFFQGAAAVAAPFFVLERHFDYAATASLVAAAAIGSALPQIPIGLLADRQRMAWAPPLGILLAAVGIGLAGVLHSYPHVLTVLLLAGLGAALYHPVAGRDARQAAGDSASAMGIFAAGGSIGALCTPLLAAPLLAVAGLTSLAWFVPLGIVAAIALARRRRGSAVAAPAVPHIAPSVDRPGQFSILLMVEVARCAASLGVSTFIALYCITRFGASVNFGQLALLLVLGGAAAGTMLGGRLGDRVGAIRVLQLGNIGLGLALAALVLTPNRIALLVICLILGVFAGLPFANLIKLGQDYLPNRRGTAAGLMFGFAVSAGGLLMPALGLLADRSGPGAALGVLVALPAIAVALSLLLRPPNASHVGTRRHRTASTPEPPPHCVTIPPDYPGPEPATTRSGRPLDPATSNRPRRATEETS
jgi:FSR family fosmidomycin resistance protein-like MFS transporter